MRQIIDDRLGQLVGPRKCTGTHGFSRSRINRLAVTLENRLTRNTEHVTDLLPRSAGLSRLLHSRGHQRLSLVLDLVRSAHQFERIVLVPQNRGSENLAELAVKLLTSHSERSRHMSILN
jgi:hypothetical protein